jgi:hypothetical protein
MLEVGKNMPISMTNEMTRSVLKLEKSSNFKSETKRSFQVDKRETSTDMSEYGELCLFD